MVSLPMVGTVGRGGPRFLIRVKIRFRDGTEWPEFVVGTNSLFLGWVGENLQRGVVLLPWFRVISLLAVIAGNFAYSMRGEAQIARNLVSTAQARA